jgi:predicted GTPase/tetrahydromethanopterin S-methyltransferase subunit G
MQSNPIKDPLENSENNLLVNSATTSFPDTDSSQDQKLLVKLMKKLHEGQNNKFVLMLAGRTGVGKSSTINSLLGTKIAKVSRFEPATMRVHYYESSLNNIRFDLVDTPGLCDDLEEVGNDEAYLSMIRNKVPQIDVMLFVSRLDEARVTGDEKRGIQLISHAFTPQVWERAVIVFTHANSVPAKQYREILEKRTDLIERVIARYTGVGIAREIPSVAIDNMSKTTIDGEEWLGQLYTKVFIRISQNGVVPFLLATAPDLMPQQVANPASPSLQSQVGTEASSSYPDKDAVQSEPRIKLNQDHKQEIKKKIDSTIVSGLSTVGASVGTFIDGNVGASIGSAIGAVIGLLALLLA